MILEVRLASDQIVGATWAKFVGVRLASCRSVGAMLVELVGR